MVNVIRNILQSTAQQPLALRAIDQARIAGVQFTSELRGATTGSDGSFPLISASSTEITFFSPQVTSSTTIDRIRYFVVGGKLYKGVLSASGSPATYNPALEKITAVLTLVSTSTPVFTYYDNTYSGVGTSTALTQPVMITSVAYAQMNLTLLRQENRNATSTFVLTTGATIRNLKNNLGN